jgi:prevent-host-death family protein
MKIAPLAEVKAQLSSYVEQAQNEGPIVITRNGKAVAVLIAPNDDEDLENLLLSRSPRLQAILNQSRNSIKQGKGLSSNQFWEAVEENTQVSDGEGVS